MKKIGIIGCGARSHCYLLYIKDSLNTDFEVVALADPNQDARKYYHKEYGNERTRHFATAEELMAAVGDDLDAVIIGSPNAVHLDAAELAFRRGLVTALEKPVEISFDRCAAVWNAWNEGGQPPTALGFVLRYTAFYGKIKELLDTGEIGRILSIEATEMLGAPLSAMFFRCWRRNSTLSGPFLLEKCSHDLDLLLWFAGSPVTRVSSFANRTRFVPDPQAADRCPDCALRDTCRYDSRRHVPQKDDPLSEFWYIRMGKDRDTCVFNVEKDIVDNQTTILEFDNGVLATFTTTMDQPRTTRRIKINGTDGQIIGDIGKDDLRVVHDAVTDTYAMGTIDWERTYPLVYDGSAHHGGDSVLSRQFHSMLRGETTPPLAGLREGVEASILALAAQQSVDTGQTVDMKPVYHKVFAPGVSRLIQ